MILAIFLSTIFKVPNAEFQGIPKPVQYLGGFHTDFSLLTTKPALYKSSPSPHSVGLNAITFSILSNRPTIVQENGYTKTLYSPILFLRLQNLCKNVRGREKTEREHSENIKYFIIGIRRPLGKPQKIWCFCAISIW